MKLTADIIIAREKLTNYLLQWRTVSDKSRYLAKAGYTSENWETLQQDIIEQILPHDAEWQEEDEYGVFYVINGTLVGPNGKSLFVKTIWIKEHFTQKTRFVTLFPQ
ncbi:MAG: hypothetical protein Q7T20_00815 [Saprospiraceae bacterium]|nr:hypothetical protein [Saprospiraceae bacterium]